MALSVIAFSPRADGSNRGSCGPRIYRLNAAVEREIRAAGMKISHVEASEITKAANALIEADPSFIEQATANIEARAEKKVTTVDIKSLIHESPKLVEAANKRKAEAKTQLSAKQAGKPAAAPRKGSQPHA